MVLFIKDRNQRVDFFNDFGLNLKYDSVASGFSFSFYFDPHNNKHRELACIGHYHECTVEHNGELLLTGVVLSAGFSDASARELISIGGYTKTGVLEDCQIPPSMYPLQSNGLSLKEIAQKLIKPFGIKLVIDPAVEKKVSAPYRQIKAKETQTVKGYLSDLASQRNVILSHTSKGELLFTESKASAVPIFDFTGGMPGTTMTLQVNGQGLHSEITVMKQADSDGGNAGQYTLKNPYVFNTFRPKVATQNSGDDISTVEAARRALAEELKNISLTIETDRWEIGGKIIKPNNIITVTNPEINLYNKTRWLIESVDLKGDESSYTATLNCVLPEVYSGKKPVYVFSNLH